MTSGRILAVDPGTARIGLALSDESKRIALPLKVLSPPTGYLKELESIAHEYDIEHVVVGLPKRLDGTEGPSALEARRVATEIESHLGIKVEMYDERLTTKAAERTLRQTMPGRKIRRVVDESAAALILQSYLDEKAGK